MYAIRLLLLSFEWNNYFIIGNYPKQVITTWCILFGCGKNHRNGFIGDNCWKIGRLFLYRDVGFIYPWFWNDCGYIFHLLPRITLSIYFTNGSKFGHCIWNWIKVDSHCIYFFFQPHQFSNWNVNNKT